MLAAKKLAVVHVAKTQLGLEDDDYRAILTAEAGVRSARDLNDAGFDRVMARFARLGFASSSPKRPRKRVAHAPDDPVTDQQRWAIEQNYLAMAYDTPERQQGFNVRQCGLAWPQTVHDAQKVIQGQVSILRRAERPAK
jgi:hypothetical protein